MLYTLDHCRILLLILCPSMASVHGQRTCFAPRTIQLQVSLHPLPFLHSMHASVCFEAAHVWLGQVAVPRNSALVVSRGKGGLLDVVQAPLAAAGVHPRQLEVQQ